MHSTTRRGWVVAAAALSFVLTLSWVASAGSGPHVRRPSAKPRRDDPAGDAITASPPTWGPYPVGFGTPVFAADGTMFVPDCGNARVYHLDEQGRASVFAGSGPGGYVQWQEVEHLGWITLGSYGGDGRHPTDAQFNCPIALALDDAGNLFVSDHGNSRIREISTSGFVSTVAGVGPGVMHAGPWTPGVGPEAGDGGPAVHGILDGPWGMAFDATGNLFVADRDHHAIREISTEGVITTVAGVGRHGYNGDGIPATEAKLNRAIFVAFDADGNLLISDENNYRIRMIDRDGIISTVAGDGRFGCGGDGGPATEASFRNPGEIAVGPDGSIVISDGECFRVRIVAPDGTISTLAGSGRHGCGGIGRDVSKLRIGGDVGLRYGPDGDLYLVDCDRIVRVDDAGITHLVATPPARRTT